MLKKILLLLPLGFLLAMFMLDMGNKRTVASDEKPISGPFQTIVIGYGYEPKWSPDGKKLSFVSSDGWITVVDIKNLKDSLKVVEPKAIFAMPLGYDWLDTLSFLLWGFESVDPERKSFRRETCAIYTYTLGQGKELVVRNNAMYQNISTPIFLPDGSVGFYKDIAKQELVTKGNQTAYQIQENPDKTFQFIKYGRLTPEEAGKQMQAVAKPVAGPSPWGAVWVESVDGKISRKISKGDATYLFPKLSPDGQKILCSSQRGEKVVFDLDGNQLAALDRGDFETWSPNSHMISFAVAKFDEYSLLSSDLFVEDWNGNNKIQITNTPDELETKHAWSPDSKMLACTYDNNRKIVVIKLGSD